MSAHLSYAVEYQEIQETALKLLREFRERGTGMDRGLSVCEGFIGPFAVDYDLLSILKEWFVRAPGTAIDGVFYGIDCAVLHYIEL